MKELHDHLAQQLGRRHIDYYTENPPFCSPMTKITFKRGRIWCHYHNDHIEITGFRLDNLGDTRLYRCFNWRDNKLNQTLFYADPDFCPKYIRAVFELVKHIEAPGIGDPGHPITKNTT